ncbi:MAG: OB-fold putative lipoprotein [Bacteroidales bacterium]|nr:OB-fold putative lipoprotein [Bacteroidales bacterium]MCF8403103.1 OB-fold putative lipoprotein [Bacteroidales bacterium]
MNKWIKYLIIVTLIGLIGAFLGYKFVYNKPHVNYEKAKPDYEVTADALFAEYSNFKQEAQKKYNGKVIKVTGILSKIENTSEFTIAVFALAEGMFGDEGIRATLLPAYALSIVEFEGKEITLKGYCTGYNDSDVILLKCSIIK